MLINASGSWSVGCHVRESSARLNHTACSPVPPPISSTSPDRGRHSRSTRKMGSRLRAAAGAGRIWRSGSSDWQLLRQKCLSGPPGESPEAAERRDFVMAPRLAGPMTRPSILSRAKIASLARPARSRHWAPAIDPIVSAVSMALSGDRRSRPSGTMQPSSGRFGPELIEAAPARRRPCTTRRTSASPCRSRASPRPPRTARRHSA